MAHHVISRQSEISVAFGAKPTCADRRSRRFRSLMTHRRITRGFRGGPLPGVGARLCVSSRRPFGGVAIGPTVHPRHEPCRNNPRRPYGNLSNELPEHGGGKPRPPNEQPPRPLRGQPVEAPHLAHVWILPAGGPTDGKIPRIRGRFWMAPDCITHLGCPIERAERPHAYAWGSVRAGCEADFGQTATTANPPPANRTIRCVDPAG